MGISMKESHAAAAMGELLASFLPGSGARQWSGHESIQTIAEKLGLGAYWHKASKRVMIAHLLEQTLLQKRERFEPFILEVVRAGIRYREKSGNPITKAEIEELNGHIYDVGFKFPELWDPLFLTSVGRDRKERAAQCVQDAVQQERIIVAGRSQRAETLTACREKLIALFVEPNRQRAGLSLEELLNKLFESGGLEPRRPFKLVGEQIDGSFVLDYENYLLEAKWERDALPAAPLMVFREKVTGKSQHTRGVFLAMNGITEEAKAAIVCGKQPTFFVITGHDLMMVLEGALAVDEFLRQRQRLLADEGAMFVPFADLYAGSRAR